ncbi:MAG: biotin--[acetyl-CoA-carboxylase] ligase [Maribacter sp.]|nr:biotin--[acetyl-CoA-carboxylase] ligase [Maribacter sp.]
MQIIKLNATDSTNLYLKELMSSRLLEDYTIVVTDEQKMGRGQMGTKWESKPFKNLTFSILKNLKFRKVTNPFELNICVSLAIYSFLNKLNIPDLTIKWPNDILSGNYKICGILIENMLVGNRLIASVIGIGLNINQVEFNNLPNVSSLKLLMGKTFNLDQLLLEFQSVLKQTFLEWEDKGTAEMQKKYENVLFRKDKPSTFKDIDGNMFMGFIRGVSNEGRLVVTLEDNVHKEFDMKAIQLLY